MNIYTTIIILYSTNLVNMVILTYPPAPLESCDGRIAIHIIDPEN